MEAQKLYDSLKQFMAKLPSYTVKEQLLTTQVDLIKKQLFFSHSKNFFLYLESFNSKIEKIKSS